MAFCCGLIPQIMLGSLGEPSLSLLWVPGRYRRCWFTEMKVVGTGAEQRQEQRQMERRQSSLAGESKGLIRHRRVCLLPTAG